jgi:GNAT superfamily N-acetyltransferase
MIIMPDMLVHLRKLPQCDSLFEDLASEGITIQRAIAPDKFRIVNWVKEYNGNYAAGECDVSLSKTPSTCFLAVREKQILGFACYNATAPNFFGPTMVLDSERGKGIGKALLLKCLYAMRDEGYVYGIIGGVGPAEFYEKCVGAMIIPESSPGIYSDFLMGNEQ